VFIGKYFLVFKWLSSCLKLARWGILIASFIQLLFFTYTVALKFLGNYFVIFISF